MAKSKTFRVVNGRMQFKCYSCQASRMVTVPPDVRRRSIRCHKCKEVTHCNLNRRRTLREQQRGKALVHTNDGSQLSVDLYDISQSGVGFDILFKDKSKLAIGKELKIRCSWNPRLLGQGRYVVKSIKGLRIGAQWRR